MAIFQALATHSGIIHVLDYTGARVKSYRSHTASIIDMCFDETADFIASASIDGTSQKTCCLSKPK